MRLAGRVAALIAFGLLTGLVATEIALRCFGAPADFHFPTNRLSDSRFSERAGTQSDGNNTHYSFDADGFRRSSDQPGAAARTILFLGDSFTQGFGVADDETFAAATCRALRAGGIDARCLNAGVTGFGTSHELRLMRRILAQRPVDAIVFQFCPYNDLRDDWEDGGFGLENGALVTHDPPAIPWEIRLRDALLSNDFIHHSPLVALAANAWVHQFGIDQQSNPETFALAEQLRREVVATAQRQRIPIVLMVTASEWALNGRPIDAYDERARTEAAAATAQALQVPWIDTRRIAPQPEHYIPNDGHFSAAGNAVVGAALAEQLTPLLRHQ